MKHIRNFATRTAHMEFPPDQADLLADDEGLPPTCPICGRPSDCPSHGFEVRS